MSQHDPRAIKRNDMEEPRKPLPNRIIDWWKNTLIGAALVLTTLLLAGTVTIWQNWDELIALLRTNGLLQKPVLCSRSQFEPFLKRRSAFQLPIEALIPEVSPNDNENCLEALALAKKVKDLDQRVFQEAREQGKSIAELSRLAVGKVLLEDRDAAQRRLEDKLGEIERVK